MKRYIGDKKFYLMVFTIVLPIVIQNAVTSFVSMLDNMMVGQVGTLPMSGVSITNQLINIFYLLTYGSLAAIGIFLTQYAGKKDIKGQQDCFHFKILISLFIFLAGTIIFKCFGVKLIALYLNNSVNTKEEIQLTLNYGLEYLNIMIIGLLPFVLTQAFSSSLRETGETVLPMIASSAAILVNFIGNYILIFGHFGAPALGINGAAIATVLSRIAELVIIISGAFKTTRIEFLNGIIRPIHIPKELILKVLRKGSPLIFNELLYSVGMAMIAQCYSTRGITTVAAINIVTTVTSVFNIACYAMGNAISILVGQRLGANDTKGAMDTDLKLLFFDGFICTIIGLIMFFVAPLFPNIYNTTTEVKTLAASLLKVSALMSPVIALYLGSYFTLRSGGKTILTFFFDGAYTVCISLSIAYMVCHFTTLNPLLCYIIVQSADIPKMILGLFLVKKGIWIHNIVN